MRKLFLLAFSSLIILICQAQGYWQQQVNYSIDVSLNDQQHTLEGFEKISYSNNSPDTLHFIWFHLWPNAYKNDQTAYTDQALENGNTRFYFSMKEQKGYINRLDFKVGGATAELEDHPQYIDIVKLILPQPLPPGASTEITTPFHVQLPNIFSRSGHDGDSYQITQWYPKPAVYDAKGWHPIPYLDQGEFYSEYGNFDVRITVPENYVVAATGVLQSGAEREWLLRRKDYDWKPLKKKIKKYGSVKTITQYFPTSAVDIKTLEYRQDSVHDFAWFADKRFIVSHDTCALASGKIIDVYAFYTPTEKKNWSKTISYAKDAILTHSSWIGEYPFSVVSVVQGPRGFAGGMEYPTITNIEPTQNEKILDYTVSHELGHNWFYGIIGSNERQYPWMDEGINSYYDNRYSKWKYGNKGEFDVGNKSLSVAALERILFETEVVRNKDQVINTPADSVTGFNYSLISYYKTSAWLEYLESQIGTAEFDKAMKAYYEKWKYKHPAPGDFKQVLTESSRQSLDSFFSILDKKGILPQHARQGTKVGFILNPAHWINYINKPSRNLVSIGPAIGFNEYDKLMVGGMVTNMKLPSSPFEYFLAPMYGINSKRFTGTGLAQYSIYPKAGIFQRIRLGISGSTFSIYKFTDDNDKDIRFAMSKLAPSLRLTLKEKNPRSTRERYLQFKSYFIREEALNNTRDSIFNGMDTTLVTAKHWNNLVYNHLQFLVQDHRALYPYRAELKLEQGKNFIRAGFTGNYFFNYAKDGGLNARFFAGKFFFNPTNSSKQIFKTSRYHLSLTGADGNEDYTYSDYFIGRNEFKGLGVQQIMERDGAFKVRSNLLGNEIGQSDDWLIAANFSTSIPSGNLPLKIPFKVFADVGTYAEAWEKGADTDRFLFDVGIHIPLFNELVNFYVPIVYSKIFKDYILSTVEKKNRFFRTISFTINVSNFDLNKFTKGVSY